MPALHRRREKWETENRQRLELVLDVSQDQIQKQIKRMSKTISFLLYLIYGGSLWLLRIPRVLWVHPKEEAPEHYAAEQQRLKSRIHPSLWLK